MEIFGIGAGELLLVMVLALIVLGPEKLPEVAGQIGRTVADLKRQANQLTEEFQRSLDVATQERKEQREAVTTPPPAPSAVCPHCGAQVTAGARFCPDCGGTQTEPAPVAERGIEPTAGAVRGIEPAPDAARGIERAPDAERRG